MKQLWVFAIVLAILLPHLHAQDSFTIAIGGRENEHANSIVPTRDGGYAVAGFTFSYGAGKSDVFVVKLDRNGDEQWRQVIGGDDFDWANAIIETSDGSFAVTGYKKDPNTGTNKAWVIRLEKNGEIRWEYAYGGDKGDEAKDIIQTQDGGFAVVGFSYSFSKGKSDIWLLRLDGKGKELWNKNIGGAESEQASSIIEDRSGNLIVAGSTKSFGNGKSDMLLMKFDAKGKGIWKKNFGGSENDVAESVIQTKAGDLLVAGWTASKGMGRLDGYIIKVNADGRQIWEHTYGKENNDAFRSITTAGRSGFVAVGTTNSYGAGQNEMWIIRLDDRGSEEWEKHSSAPEDDYANAVAETKDGGFVIAGGTQSYAKGGSDLWVMKMKGNGKIENEPEPMAQNDRPAETDPEPIASNNNDLDDGNVSKDDALNQMIKPNMYILAVGVSEYFDPAANLTYAHIDAQSIANRFKDMEGVLFNKVKVRTVLNKNATLVNIKTGIAWLEQNATQNDVILMFLSSHGALDHKGNLYLLPTDFNPNNLFATALNIKEVTEGMNGVPCKKLVLMDACHSGQSGFDLLEFANTKSVDVDNIVKELIDKEPGLTVMTSSSGREYSYENSRWGHGAFTKAILEGLDGEADINKNEVINLTELNWYVTERVKELTRGRQHPYTPINLFGDIPLFILEDE